MHRILAVAKREYMARLRTKTFLVGTIMTPVVALAVLVAYLLVSGEVFLATAVNGVFRMSFLGFGPTELRILLAIGTLALFAVNALVPHVAVALLLGRYNPGAVTAAALVLPVAAWVFTATLRDGTATPRGAAVATVAGTVVYVLFLSAVRGG